MLMNCPRCGFDQPQDQYCAQCGVDMLKFRAPTVPLFKRVLNNAVLQVTLVLLISGGVGYSLYLRRHSELQDRVRYLKGALVQHSEGAPGSASESASTAAADAMPAELLKDGATPATDARAAVAAGAGANAKATPDAAKSGANDADKAATGAVARGPLTLHMVFAEVSQSSLMQIYDVSRSTGQFNSFGNFVAGILPDVDRRLSGGSGIRVLGRETRSIDGQHPVQFFQGIRGGEADAELGFTYYVEVTDGENEAVRGNVEVARSWRESPGPNQPPVLQKTTYPAVFELQPGAGFFMARLLSPTPVAGPDLEVLSVSPFQILRSNDFRGGQSEYVLFLTFERPRSTGAGSGAAAGAAPSAGATPGTPTGAGMSAPAPTPTETSPDDSPNAPKTERATPPASRE